MHRSVDRNRVHFGPNSVRTRQVTSRGPGMKCDSPVSCIVRVRQMTDGRCAVIELRECAKRETGLASHEAHAAVGLIAFRRSDRRNTRCITKNNRRIFRPSLRCREHRHRQMQTRRERGPSLSCLERRITKHARLQTVGKNPDERRGIAELSGLME